MFRVDQAKLAWEALLASAGRSLVERETDLHGDLPMGQVAVFRATVPTGMDTSKAAKFVGQNFIDDHTSRKWTDLGLVASSVCSDEQFIRRVYVDLCGKLPEAEAVRKYVKETYLHKREKLVDRLRR